MQWVERYTLLKCQVAKLPSKKGVPFFTSRFSVWKCLFSSVLINGKHYPTFSFFADLICKNFYLVLIFIYLCMNENQHAWNWVFLYIFASQCTSFSVNYLFMSFTLQYTVYTSNLACLSWFPVDSGRYHNNRITSNCRLTRWLWPVLQKN